MRKILLLAALATGAWYYFVGGRLLDEERIYDFYDQQTRATLSRNPEALCKQLHSDYRGVNEVSVGGQRLTEDVDRDEACEAAHGTYESIEGIGKALGGIATIEYGHEVQSITLSDDKKQATVETSFTMNIAGTVMSMRGTSTDTLIRRNGKVLLLRTEGATRMWSG